jgi:hypothetical protein
VEFICLANSRKLGGDALPGFASMARAGSDPLALTVSLREPLQSVCTKLIAAVIRLPRNIAAML